MYRVRILIFMFIVYFSNLLTWEVLPGISGFKMVIYFFFLFLILSVYDLKRFYSLRNNLYIFLPLLLFMIWWFLRSISTFHIIPFYNTSLWQWVLLFILFTNYISGDIKIGYYALLAYLLSAVTLLLLFYTGKDINYLGSRLTILPTNPNQIGEIISIALIISFSFVVKDILHIGKWRYLFIISIPFLIHLLVESGSRGALIYFVVAIVFFLMINRSKFTWVLILLTVVLVLTGFIQSYLTNSEIFQNRWFNSDLSSLGGRERLWASHLHLISQKPIIGFGDRIFFTYKDPHNVFIVILVTTGIIGLVFFLVFLYRIMLITITGILYRGNSICFLLFLISLMVMFKQGGVINRLGTWLVLSIIAGLSIAIKNEFESNQE